MADKKRTLQTVAPNSTTTNMAKVSRDIRFSVRFSDDELKKFTKLAESRHTDLSEVIRQLLHREADLSKGQAA